MRVRLVHEAAIFLVQEERITKKIIGIKTGRHTDVPQDLPIITV